MRNSFNARLWQNFVNIIIDSKPIFPKTKFTTKLKCTRNQINFLKYCNCPTILKYFKILKHQKHCKICSAMRALCECKIEAVKHQVTMSDKSDWQVNIKTKLIFCKIKQKSKIIFSNLSQQQYFQLNLKSNKLCRKLSIGLQLLYNQICKFIIQTSQIKNITFFRNCILLSQKRYTLCGSVSLVLKISVQNTDYCVLYLQRNLAILKYPKPTTIFSQIQFNNEYTPES
eukprot:TRINITY_DN6385_c0_g2_i8.p3 TRINITY_DN6385_c0_g2~~TRINITY_DN6385_c0_g2_i8.p3  ORF type:complete len:228 (+),score=-23.35 TRINITY_DN6385_c0_g2_i8:564-1247(+)